ncbi:MFS transporter [Raineyella sp. W15-4]|uniref:MFS transporter n=1 Tax=Raineyella sp. W15-4 TaxID=3081651 RepID=UPI0029557A2E|nr:MFS transporter [Raineyella sp. W15-4]WOQ16735.1 MFS transporter [Raineyella sp. W15-4]
MAQPRTVRRTPDSLLVTILCATGVMVALQPTLLIPLLPELPRLLGTGYEDASWTVTAALLSSAVATPIVSKLADMYGKRRMVLACLVLMAIGSVLGAVSNDLAVVVAGRALQGVAAGLTPVGMSIMRDELPKEKVGGAVALMSSTIGIGAALGLPTAGLITARWSWHALFWTSAAVAGVLIALVLLIVPESTVRTPGRFDLLGAVLLSAALVSLLLAVTKGGHWGWWSHTTLLCVLLGVVLLAAWLPWELRIANPMVDLRTAIRRPVLLTNVATLLVGFSMFGNMQSTTQLLQLPLASGYGFQLSVLATGLALVPSSLSMVAVSPVGAVLVRRIGARPTIIVGAVVLALGYVQRIVLMDQLWHIVLGSVIASAGTALAYAAIPTVIMGAVPITETAAANGLNVLLRSVGTSTASAVLAALLTNLTMTVDGGTLPRVDAFLYCFWLSAAAALLAALVTVFLPRSRSVAKATSASEEHVWTGTVTSAGRPVRHGVVTLLTTAGEQLDWGHVNPDGTYRITLPGPGRYVRVATSDGWPPVSAVVRVAGPEDLAVELGPRLHIGGTVTRAGAPVPGALVTLTRATGELVSTTPSGPDGRFRLPLPAPGRHVLTAVDTEAGEAASAAVLLTGVTRTIDLDLAGDRETAGV